MLCQYNEELCLMQTAKTKVSDNVACLYCRLPRMQMTINTPQVMLRIKKQEVHSCPTGGVGILCGI